MVDKRRDSCVVIRITNNLETGVNEEVTGVGGGVRISSSIPVFLGGVDEDGFSEDDLDPVVLLLTVKLLLLLLLAVLVLRPLVVMVDGDAVAAAIRGFETVLGAIAAKSTVGAVVEGDPPAAAPPEAKESSVAILMVPMNM
mmetsp:Transcript_20572/g.35089  ORF Transcript_20572/g.35089 Transcript_20572/m.35089 type:complete len:141 (-) Transcript_20572:160-582(-)